jgi:CspA family cold shock protein
MRKPGDGAAAVDAEGQGQNAAASTPVIRGRLKWFDAVRGYGFVEVDDGCGDLLLHYTVLKSVNRRSLPEGATLDCAVIAGGRGRQVAALMNIDLSTAVGPDPDALRQRENARTDPLSFIDRAGDFKPVTVRWFNRIKGYGFLLDGDGLDSAPGENEIFVHMETVRRAGLFSLEPGQSLRARVAAGPKGPMAVVLEVG